MMSRKEKMYLLPKHIQKRKEMLSSRHKKLFSKFPHTKDTVQTHKNEQTEREKIHTKETKIL
jgi:hypothetical protein